MATGQYIKQNLLASDIGTTEVLASKVPDTSYEATSAIDCRGYRQVDFFVHLTLDGTGVATITVKPESGHDLAGTTKYATYLTEVVASGVATTHDYEIELTDPTPADDTVYKVSLPVEGRYVRLQIKANSTGGGNARYTVYATRRV
tara:strand:- start:12 stop:449 length:438 start_codon:yes stop_codon:yes gene_type:complete